jgi:recombinational DNA repair protein (RecF pathway)
MINKLDEIKLFCSECGGQDDNAEFTFQQGSLLCRKCYDAASLIPTPTG